MGCDQASQDMSIVVDSKPTSNMPNMPFKESGLDAVVDDWLKYCVSCQLEVLHRFLQSVACHATRLRAC